MKRLSLALLLLLAPGCREHSHDPETGGHSHGEEDTAWSVTAWSEHYELFAETDGLVAGVETPSHAHFTYLPDFSALNQGTVTGILRSADGGEERFVAAAPLRAGIFNVPFKPTRPGAFTLSFLVENELAREEIEAGRVAVGTAEEPGGALEAPPSAPAGGSSGGEEVSFLKEQQWRTPFATVWASQGELARSFAAVGRVRPAAGGEALLVAPAEGLLRAERWPRPGLEVQRGATLFELAPKVVGEESAAQRAARVTALEAENGVAAARLVRLRELLSQEAVSRREVEEAEARAAGLTAQLEATRRDQAAASAQRGGAAERFRVASPIVGRVVEVLVSPGQFVAAGTTLARVVATSPVWLELALSPADAARFGAGGAGATLALTRFSGEAPLEIPASELKLVTLSPEIDAATGTVAAFFEVARSADELRLGSRVEAEVLLAETLRGIVLPEAAMIDDSGVPVVYLQLSGESFERREVQVVERAAGRVLVSGISAGERVVVAGGNAIRRSVLLGSGAVEGHVH